MRGWVVSPIIGSGSETNPVRPQVVDREALPGDRLDIVIGESDYCLVAYDVKVDNFGDYGGISVSLDRARLIGRMLDSNFHEGKLLGNSQPPPTGSFLVDTMTDTDGVFLQAHTPNVGTSWTKASYAVTELRFTSNRLRPNGNGTLALCYASPTPATADYDIEAVIRIVSQGPAGVVCSAGVSGRRLTATDDGYDLYVNKDAADLQFVGLRKRVAAVSTVLSFWAANFPNGADITILLELRDAAKKFYVDGVQRGSTTDNVHTTAGVASAWVFQGSGVGDAVGYHIDSITATDAVEVTARGPYRPNYSKLPVEKLRSAA